MNIMFWTDCHWSQNSSIVRSRGDKYSTRLENLIASINEVERAAWYANCKYIVCGGDFFDSCVLNSEEVSALKEIQWAPITHIFITGNHESNVSSLEYSTTDIFNLCPNSVIISTPQMLTSEDGSVEMCFLPYITERDRQPIETYFPQRDEARSRIIFSHNDLKNVQYGPFLSTEGFTVEEIENNCDLCLNGHIHHCAYVSNKIINGGNLTGQNFTEDAYKFEHCWQIINTDTLHVDFYINPHAFNFYKVDATTCNTLEEVVNKLSSLKQHAVITLKTHSNLASAVRDYLKTVSKDSITEYRLIVESNTESVTDSSVQFEAVDHLKQFENYVLNNIGSTDVIQSELTAIMR